MKIAIQVMTPPYSYQDMDSAIKIAEAALNKGYEVAIFLFADAVNAANSRVKPIRVDRNIQKVRRAHKREGFEGRYLRIMYGIQGTRGRGPHRGSAP